MKDHPYLTFGPANDEVGLASLAIGMLFVLLALFRGRALGAAFDRVPSRWLVGVLSLVAATLSWLYLAHYLGGGPRIVDATAYWLEARVLSTGHFTFDVPDPSGSFRGRFLLPTPDGRLSVIFPPGYPLLLAAGFLIGSPLVMGPLVAGLLVVATHFTTRTLLDDERVARVAALVSVLCVALRYHTADTMSHGFSALLFTLTLGCAAQKTPGSVVLAGLAAGWLVATRPMTGIVAIAVALFSLRPRFVLAPVLFAALLPGIGLVAAHAHAATGSFFGSTQLAYYALADGPPGCFRLGFGSGIGCRFEHGDFVKEHLRNGFGPLEASWITLERLVLHGIDVSNLFPLSLVVPWAAFRFRKMPGVLTLALAPVLVVLAYSPFYFPGSYPGAGARFFADVLPLEHGLLALGLSRLGLVRFAPGAMLLGFSLHAVHQHIALAEREGGKPMFSMNALGDVRRGIVFVRTDHGFMLGHDPTSNDAHRAIVVARGRGGAHDRILWERLGRPPTYLYDYDTDSGATRVSPYRPDEHTLRFEAEAEWPPLSVASGWAHPDFRECLSSGQGLHLRSAPSSPGVRVEIEIVPPKPGRYELAIGWLADPRTTLGIELARAHASLTGDRDGRAARGGCFDAGAFEIDLGGPVRVSLSASNDVIIDHLTLTGLESKKR
jgi:hypothetical protein